MCSSDLPNWADEVAATGIRAVLAPAFRSASWSTGDGKTVAYHWDEPAGKKGLDAAVDLVKRANQHPSGRVSAMLAPSQLDTCTPDLMRDARDAARDLGVPYQIHAAQSVVEFHEITRRHGLTPIEFLDSVGMLGPDLIDRKSTRLNSSHT